MFIAPGNPSMRGARARGTGLSHIIRDISIPRSRYWSGCSWKNLSAVSRNTVCTTFSTKIASLFNLSVLILVFLFAGCGSVDVSQQTFNPIDEKENQQVLKKIQKNTNNFQLGKCKIKLSVSTNLNGNEKKYNTRAVCLWQPGKKIRMRISHILAGTISDILFDGEKWYITDEPNSIIYVTKRIDTIRIAGFPGSFFMQMQRLPETWLPPNSENIRIGKNENSYQIINRSYSADIEWIFQLNSAFPSEMKIETENNGSLYAAFSKADTNINQSSRMFKPMLEGYEVIRMDNGVSRALDPRMLGSQRGMD